MAKRYYGINLGDFTVTEMATPTDAAFELVFDPTAHPREETIRTLDQLLIEVEHEIELKKLDVSITEVSVLLSRMRDYVVDQIPKAQ